MVIWGGGKKRVFDQKSYMVNYRRTHCAQRKEWIKQHPENMRLSYERCKLRHPNYEKECREKYKERIRTYKHLYDSQNKDKKKVQHKVEHMPLAQECEICGRTEYLQHHHPDYSEPLIFVTVCASCHRNIHN